jgi:hypothetical protein
MTEEEWLACDDPTKMLNSPLPQISPRKLRLFGIACVRRIAWLLKDTRTKVVLAAAEAFADGLIASKDAVVVEEAGAGAVAVAYEALSQAAKDWWNAYEPTSLPPEGAAECTAGQAAAVTLALWAPATWGALEAARHAAKATASRRWAERAAQAALFRDIVKKFRKSQVNLNVLAWNDGAVCKMAQAVYDARAFDRLPLLADALEDAGCDDADILSHCRTPGEHVRGCWVVDLLLGKS